MSVSMCVCEREREREGGLLGCENGEIKDLSDSNLMCVRL